MNSIRSDPAASPSFGSRASKRSTSIVTCSGSWIFGRVTTKFEGSTLPVASTSVVRKMSRVRMERGASSCVNGLMRMPMNGESEPWDMPVATSRAAVAA